LVAQRVSGTPDADSSPATAGSPAPGAAMAEVTGGRRGTRRRGVQQPDHHDRDQWRPITLVFTRRLLETHLWDCAATLRSSLDTTEVRNHVLALVFLKRLLDQAEYEATHPPTPRRKRGTGAGRGGRIAIPPGCSWADLVGTPERSLGKRLNEVTAEVGAANPSLRGVFGLVDWNARVGVGRDRRARIDGRVLGSLVRAFDAHDLSNANVDPDLLGQSYEYLLARFAGETRARGGEYYTPREVVETLVRLLDPAPDASIHDPTCGSGGMLVYAAEWMRGRYGPDAVSGLRLSGQERNAQTWAIAKMNALVHGLDADIRGPASTLTEPEFVRDGRLEQFDLILGNFPFADPDWGHDRLQADPYGRMKYGLPPPRSGDYAYLQHIVACMGDAGRAGLVCGQSVLFHAKAEGGIRRRMLEDDLFEAVVALPGKLFGGVGSPTCLVLLSRCKPRGRRGKVLFVDASGDCDESTHPSRLRSQDVDRIVEAHRRGRDVEGHCRLVDVKEIAANGHGLTVGRYVHGATEERGDGLREAVAALRDAWAAQDEAMRELDRHLEELDLDG